MSENGEMGHVLNGILIMMMDKNAIYYNALRSRDTRFDGVFFVGVTSTGIYCRPVCPTKTPMEENCRFFGSASAAEKASFRPCLRCRPELAPGNAPMDEASRVANLLAQRIEEGLIESSVSIEEIAEEFEISSRQLRRIVQQELGVSPVEWIQTRRLLLAKQLLTETRLPVLEIAFASGFSSLRRFNDAFSKRYRMPPTRLRQKATETHDKIIPTETSTLRLTYRPPYDWQSMLDFLNTRRLIGVEWISDDTYYRTVALGGHKGWIAVRHAPEKSTLLVEFTHTLIPVLPALLGRLRHLFDLSARPDLIAHHLKQDKLLKKMVDKNPGLRVPGAFDSVELAMRAILGQQVTVKAATTLACRFVETFGEKIETPFPELNRLTPTAESIAKISVEELTRLGIIRTRAASMIRLANDWQSETLQLHPGMPPQKAISALTAIPGIGQWTAHYIAMRALRWPDAFPKEDIAIRNSLGGVTAKQAEDHSQAWRPWRSYAVLYLWKNPPPKTRLKTKE